MKQKVFFPCFGMVYICIVTTHHMKTEIPFYMLANGMLLSGWCWPPEVLINSCIKRLFIEQSIHYPII